MFEPVFGSGPATGVGLADAVADADGAPVAWLEGLVDGVALADGRGDELDDGRGLVSTCHDRFVSLSLWEGMWRIGLPLVVVGGAAAAVPAMLSSPPAEFSRPCGWQWTWVGLWLMTVGDAAFGDNRSWFERAWKGASALLVAVAVAVAAWRRFRWRRRIRLADDSPPPVIRSDS